MRKMSEKERAKELMYSIMSQCGEVRDRHAAMAATDFNDDTVYRGLVTEMLEMKTHAVVKMDYLLSQRWVWPSDLALSLRTAFHDRMAERERKVVANPSAEDALDMCQYYGLLRKEVNEVNEAEETPLIVACADKVLDDKLKLLLMAGWLRLERQGE